jgi:hypothetical protein
MQKPIVFFGGGVFFLSTYSHFIHQQQTYYFSMASNDSVCFSKADTSTTELCGGCKRWKRELVRVRRSRWRPPPIRYKCVHGPHTEEFYLGSCEVIVVDVAVADAGQTEPRSRHRLEKNLPRIEGSLIMLKMTPTSSRVLKNRFPQHQFT